MKKQVRYGLVGAIFSLILIMTCFVFSVQAYNNWHVQTVDSEGDVGKYTSLAFDSNDNPCISYIASGDYPNGVLKYARWTGSSWDIQNVTTFFEDNYGYTSLALGYNDYPHISFYNGVGLMYAFWNGTAWTIRQVASLAWAGNRGTSLALDAIGLPCISYNNPQHDELLYSRADILGNWVEYTVDTDGVGEYSSLALDSSGNPHISYYDMKENDLKYAKWNGAGWDIQTVDSPYDVGRCSSLALDSNDNPCISYFYDHEGYVMFANWTGSDWDIMSATYVGDTSEHYGISLALDPNDEPYVSCYTYNGGVGGLVYSKARDWGWEEVVEAGDVGDYSSLAFDSQGYPHISYYDKTNGALKYASVEPETPYSVTIEAWDIEGWQAEPISMDYDYTGFTTPHEFTGLTGWHIFQVPISDSNGYYFANWNTGRGSSWIVINSSGVYVARYTPMLSVSLAPDSSATYVGLGTLLTAAPSGGSGTYESYQCYVDGESASNTTTATFNYVPDAEGNYSITVCVTDSLGVTSYQSTPVSVTVSPMIPDFASYLFLPFLMLATLSAIALKKRFRK